MHWQNVWRSAAGSCPLGRRRSDRVYRTGQPETHTEEQVFTLTDRFLTYTMWPVMAPDQPVGVMLQVIVTTKQQKQTVAMNEALVLGSVHQHELTEAS